MRQGDGAFDTLLIHDALDCQCMWQGDGACSDVMMVKHACSKQRVIFFVITAEQKEKKKVELSLSHRQRANLIYRTRG